MGGGSYGTKETRGLTSSGYKGYAVLLLSDQAIETKFASVPAKAGESLSSATSDEQGGG